MSETGATINELNGRPFYSRLAIGGLITIRRDDGRAGNHPACLK